MTEEGRIVEVPMRVSAPVQCYERFGAKKMEQYWANTLNYASTL